MEKKYIFGPDYLVAPVLETDVRKISEHLPWDVWTNIDSDVALQDDKWVEVSTPLDVIPVFKRG